MYPTGHPVREEWWNLIDNSIEHEKILDTIYRNTDIGWSVYGVQRTG